MIRRIVSFILTLFILQAFAPELPALAAEGEKAQSLEQMKKVVQKAIKKNKSVKVVMKDKHKYEGPVTDATEEGFAVSDKKTATPVRIAFVDVEHVTLKGMPTAAKVAIGAGVVFGIFLIVALAAVND
jgi:CTP synthase (UTP-ammonia lyase)